MGTHSSGKAASRSCHGSTTPAVPGRNFYLHTVSFTHRFLLQMEGYQRTCGADFPSLGRNPQVCCDTLGWVRVVRDPAALSPGWVPGLTLKEEDLHGESVFLLPGCSCPRPGPRCCHGCPHAVRQANTEVACVGYLAAAMKAVTHTLRQLTREEKKAYFGSQFLESLVAVVP